MIGRAQSQVARVPNLRVGGGSDFFSYAYQLSPLQTTPVLTGESSLEDRIRLN
jgi:hypothetical protein